MLTLITGALAGLFHVLSGPDHLAAVAPLAVAERRRAWLAGWTWGVGHASGVAAVAVLAVLFRDALPSVEQISLWGERLVGVALIAIAAWALRRSARLRPAEHSHGHVRHDHLHVQRGPSWFRRLGHAHASFYLGILHGIAGSSHFLGVLPALALPTREAALLYIAAFGAGSITAMTAFAAGIGLVGERPRAAQVQRMVLQMAALVAFLVGSVWLMA